MDLVVDSAEHARLMGLYRARQCSGCLRCWPDAKHLRLTAVVHEDTADIRHVVPLCQRCRANWRDLTHRLEVVQRVALGVMS